MSLLGSSYLRDRIRIINAQLRTKVIIMHRIRTKVITPTTTMVGITMLHKINPHGYHDRTGSGIVILIMAAYQRIMQNQQILVRPILPHQVVILKIIRIIITMMKLIAKISILKMWMWLLSSSKTWC